MIDKESFLLGFAIAFIQTAHDFARALVWGFGLGAGASLAVKVVLPGLVG